MLETGLQWWSSPDQQQQQAPGKLVRKANSQALARLTESETFRAQQPMPYQALLTILLYTKNFRTAGLTWWPLSTCHSLTLNVK